MVYRVFIVLPLIVYLLSGTQQGFAQNYLKVNGKFDEHVFSKNELYVYEDKTGDLTINDILSPDINRLFAPNKDHYPKNTNKKSYYWIRINVDITEDLSEKYLFEFYDQTTENIEAFLPDFKGTYIKRISGSKLPFQERLINHKNFHFGLENLKKGRQTYYFRVNSSSEINIIIVLRSAIRLLNYAISEYLLFGVFYGMILIFSLHNMLMYFAIGRKEYLIYVAYLLCVALFELSSDGVAFQFIWPGLPLLNPYATGVSLYFMGLSALVFMLYLLHVKSKAPVLYRVTVWVIALRTLYFLFCLIFRPEWFVYKFIEAVPLLLCFITGIHILLKGYKPARFFVVAYSLLLIGFTIRVLVVFGIGRMLPGYITYYSLSVCFILEMIFLSFSIGDQVRILRRKKLKAQEKAFKQMRINANLKDSVNKELEEKVERRTFQLKKQTEELVKNKEIIERQNRELTNVNRLLEEQKGEIAKINALLKKDNEKLKTNIEEVTEARIQSKDIEFDEFVLKYPDKESCYEFLSEIKWNERPYKCQKCSNDTYYPGKSPFGRRCTKCNYDESVLNGTIFQNSRIPINKAFYIFLLVHKNKGEISSYQLSKKTGIRQSTCWQYASNFKEIIKEKNKTLKKTKQVSWTNYLLADVDSEV